MSAVIGMPITDLLELLPGIRIAKVLWEMNSQFFDFFTDNGTFGLGLKNTVGSPSNQVDSSKF